MKRSSPQATTEAPARSAQVTGEPSMPSDPMTRRGCLRWLASGLALSGSGAGAAADFCDPSLPRLNDSPHGYRMRGERCEGIFVREVSGDELRLASLTRWFADFDPARTGGLPVRWHVPGGGGRLRLRAQGLARRSHYRMDTVCDAGSGVWTWPTDLLAARGLRRADIGVLGSTQFTIGGTSTELLLPLQIGAPAPRDAPRQLELIVVPQIELAQLFVRIEAVHGDGRPRLATPGAALEAGRGYYPAERAVRLAIEPPDSGLHRGELAAVFRQGGSASLHFWFHHAGG